MQASVDSGSFRAREETGQVRFSQSQKAMAKGLGWFSIGLGVTQVIVPDRLCTFIGVPYRPGLMRLMGAREIVSGVGIVTRPARPNFWLWSRVVGDALDLALLGMALGSDESERDRVVITTAAVAGVAAIDMISAASAPDGEPLRVRKAITINRPIDEVYRFWRDFRNLPGFMKHVVSIEILSPDRSRWTVTGPVGTHIRWDAEITEDRPAQVIAWRSVPELEVENSGSVMFRESPRGTEVHVDITYHPLGGRLGAWTAWISGEEPSQQLRDDLRRLKQMLETGEIATTAGQPSGASEASLFGKFIAKSRG
ncbi:MAG TPA: SRPBCC family protein [Acidobacteriota bacterium]|nr:SRPBCC family protein [Acidobacteriota bacterium]